MNTFPRRILLPVLLVLLAMEAHAQIQVDLSIKRRLHIIYEPIIATVSVTNLSGKDIVLRDSGANNWFSFQVETEAGLVVPATNPHYSLEPFPIGAGQTVRRTVNLTELYQVHNFGMFRLRASIYWDEAGRYFSSGKETIEITDGRVIWEKIVGVPEGREGAGGLRHMALLKHRLPKENMLYARVMDREKGVVYCTYALGRVLHTGEPTALLDVENDLHVLQIIGPKTYLYSRVGVNGEWKGHTTFMATTSRPSMRLTRGGEVVVTGGQREAAPVDVESPDVPKLSDRPPGMPES